MASVSGCAVAEAPKGCASQYDFPLLETASFLNQHPPSMFGPLITLSSALIPTNDVHPFSRESATFHLDCGQTKMSFILRP